MVENAFSFVETLTPLIPAEKGLQWYGAASEADVRAVEEKLAFQFPKDYREFLCTFGGGGLRIHEVSGIYPGRPERCIAGTVLQDTFFARTEFSLPGNYAVVFADDLEVCWAIDVSEASPAVVNYDLFHRSIDRSVAISFPDYRREQLEMAIGQ